MVGLDLAAVIATPNQRACSAAQRADGRASQLQGAGTGLVLLQQRSWAQWHWRCSACALPSLTSSLTGPRRPPAHLCRAASNPPQSSPIHLSSIRSGFGVPADLTCLAACCCCFCFCCLFRAPPSHTHTPTHTSINNRRVAPVTSQSLSRPRPSRFPNHATALAPRRPPRPVPSCSPRTTTA